MAESALITSFNTRFLPSNEHIKPEFNESREDTSADCNVPDWCTLLYDILPAAGVSGHSVQRENIESKKYLSTWHLKEDCVHEIPLYYPLEKSHAIIYGATPPVIAERIAICLRELSISAAFDDFKAIASAKTENHVHFTIRLFKQKQRSVIVELQRMKGDLFTFHHISLPILQAATGDQQYSGKSSSNHQKTLSSRTLKICLNESLSFCHHDDGTERHNIISIMDTIVALLTKDRIDAQLLGVESLRDITNPTMTKHSVSFEAAKLVLGGCQESSHHCNISNIFMSLLLNLKRVEEERSDDFNNDDVFKNYFDTLHNQTLAILGNTLCVLAMERQALSDTLKSQVWIISEAAISLLVSDLKNANAEHHNAFLAAKALYYLIRASSEAYDRAVELGAPHAAREGNLVGRRKHAALAKESQRLLDTLVAKGGK
mmetsp:Transcript_24855/g.29998  ORF Transcript_24855/g.29998 Transcript_24855/m.29998 type:complete len:432 (+) Transcript_24855:106-1401(+)|eukprot:CAMPEP_0172505308 /NCGR_PEP_ID=MMETSP1066-20121228/185344_1 /TAXON_ID=671091 /ORGANISM="Coscinodiscus wailesii, Strain CCMP2513" /LENGTH=431 /DNA_ID=CAMNT_0013281869 /DNA_START=105 /DNA_END=1400 /DNA_ORIENTATION=+